MASPLVVGEGMRKFQVAICEALGVPAQTVRAIDMHFAADGLAEVTIDYWMTQEQTDGLIRLLSTFDLHPELIISHEPRPISE